MKVRRRQNLLLFLAIALLGRASVAENGPVRRYAIVVGSNVAAGQPLAPLRFADDDALNNCELLTELGMQVTVFAEPDATTQQRWGADPGQGALARALPACSRPATPYLASVQRAFAALVRQLAASPPGTQNEVVFWFSGHGNGSALFLQDQPLTTVELQQWLLAPTRELANVHVILDTCNAHQFATGRDSAPELPSDILRRVREYPKGLDLAGNPHVGVLIATTANGRVHEWSPFEAGIFSYQLRAAFRNAADATGDRRVSYREAEAFVWAANYRVENVDARMNGEAFLPHQGRDAVIVDWNLAPVPPVVLALGATEDPHFWLVDARGVRVAETHKGRDDENGRDAVLMLRAQQSYELEFAAGPSRGTRRALPPSAPGTTLRLSALGEGKGAAREGLGIEDSLALGLFREPYSTRLFLLYQDLRQHAPDAPWFRSKGDEGAGEGGHDSRPFAFGLLAGGALAGGFGAFANAESNSAFDRWKAEVPGTASYDRRRDETRRWDWTATLSFVAAGAAGLGGLGLLLFDTPRASRPSASLRVFPRAESALSAEVQF